MKPEFSKSKVNNRDIAEGEVVVVAKHKGAVYVKAFHLKDKKLGLKVKSALDATVRVLFGDKYEA